MKTLIGLTSLVLAIAVAGSASAGISASTGDVQIALTIPSDLSAGKVESNDFIRVYGESSLSLGSNLSVDIAQSGFYDQADDLIGKGGSIPSGTWVNSYLIHVDPDGAPSSPLVEYEGTITFTNPILGLIVYTTGLNNTDSILGAAGTTYDAGTNRGLEFSVQDEVGLRLGAKSVALHLEAGDAIDEIRVLEAVPVPEAILLGFLGLGMAGMGLRRFM